MAEHVFVEVAPGRRHCRICGLTGYGDMELPEGERECRLNAVMVPWLRNSLWYEANELYASGSICDERLANVISGLASVLAGITNGHYPDPDDWIKIGPAVADVLERNWYSAKKGGKANE